MQDNMEIQNFLSICKEMDYTADSSIDSRIIQVCNDAEKNYIQNQATVKEIQKMKNFLKFIPMKSNRQQPITEIPQREMNEYLLNRDNEKSSWNTKRNNPVPEYFQNDNPDLINNKDNPRASAEFENTRYKKQNISSLTTPNESVENKKSYPQEWPFNKNKSAEFPKNSIVSQNFSNWNSKINLSHKHLKSGRKCLACELKTRIEKKGEMEHEDHLKFKINYDINKLLLNAKTQMKKLNYLKVYESLKLPISQGLYHSDIFYLYGEVCRILKHLDESEKYLLQCLKFEHHSPFVFYSLGLLYQEMLQFKYSVCFFKQFAKIYETADVHYQMAKSYVEMKKYLKAATHLTTAIEINMECIEYYKFRAEIYILMGFNELAKDDLELAKSLVKSEI